MISIIKKLIISVIVISLFIIPIVSSDTAIVAPYPPSNITGGGGGNGTMNLTPNMTPNMTAGQSATINVNHTFTLPPGSPATFINIGDLVNAIFDVGIPSGEQGLQGVTNMTPNMTANMTAGTNGADGLNNMTMNLTPNMTQNMTAGTNGLNNMTMNLTSNMTQNMTAGTNGLNNMTMNLTPNMTQNMTAGTNGLNNMTMNLTPNMTQNMTAGTNGLNNMTMNLTPNMTQNMTAGSDGLDNMTMNLTANMTAGATGSTGGTGGQILYFKHGASTDPITYEGLIPVPAGATEVDESVTVKNTLGEVLVDSYINDIGYPAVTELPAGLWRFRTFQYVNNGQGTTVTVFKVYNRTATGTETLLFTATSDDIGTTVTEYLTSYVQTTAYPVALTDRIVVKVYFTATSASNIVAHWVYEGSTHTSHIQTTLESAPATSLSFSVIAGETLYKGQAVYISGASGGNPQVSKADNTNTAKSRVIGLMADNTASGAVGRVRRAGALTSVDTRSTNTNINPLGQTWSAGDLLFATTGGGLTNIRPTSGRSVKAAYSLTGGNATDTLMAYPMENPVWATAASTEDIVLRMGDLIGINKISIRNYANIEVANITSQGLANFNGTNELANITMNNNYITGLMSGSSGGSVVNKTYVDTIAGLNNMTMNLTSNMTINMTMNLTPNMTAGTNGLNNMTPNMTANMTAGTNGLNNMTMNLTPNMTQNMTAGTNGLNNMTMNLTPNMTQNMTAGTNGLNNMTMNLTPNMTQNMTAGTNGLNNMTMNLTSNMTQNMTAGTNGINNMTMNLTPNMTQNMTAGTNGLNNMTMNLTPNMTQNMTAGTNGLNNMTMNLTSNMTQNMTAGTNGLNNMTMNLTPNMTQNMTAGTNGLNNMTMNLTSNMTQNMTAGTNGLNNMTMNLTPNMTQNMTAGTNGLNNMTMNLTPNMTQNMTAGTNGLNNMTMNLTPNMTQNMTAGTNGLNNMTMNLTPNMTANMTAGVDGLNNMTMNMTSVDTSQFLFLNGTRSMAGNLTMGSNYITGLMSGSSGGSVVNKTYIDTKANLTQYSYITLMVGSGMIPTTNPPSDFNQLETTTNKNNFIYVNITNGTSQNVQWLVDMPADWDNGNIITQFKWTVQSGTGDVNWTLSGVRIADNVALDIATPIITYKVDTVQTANYLHVSDATTATTVTGTGNTILFKVGRSETSETLTVPAQLIAVNIQYKKVIGAA